jgi:mono/diheme cytochrome c family protein
VKTSPSLFALAAGLAVLSAAPAAPQGARPGAPDTEWTAPAGERTRSSPLQATRENVERGRHLYVEHCSTCHGDKGRGEGHSPGSPAARAARPPHDLTDPGIQTMLADGEIFWKVTVGYRKDGKVVMPAYEALLPDADDRWRLVQYVRTLGPQR